MILKTYDICAKIVATLDSIIVNGNETNPVHVYSEANFSKKATIYNQIVVKDSIREDLPAIIVSEIHQEQKLENAMLINVDIVIPSGLSEEVEEVQTGQVVSYENYDKLSEFAQIVLDKIDSGTRSNVCIQRVKTVWNPDMIEVKSGQYSGTIQFQYGEPTRVNQR